MNPVIRLAGLLLGIACANLAQAATYDVSASFSDGGMQRQTVFTGSFDWDGSTVTNFTGLLSESMWGWDSAESTFTMSGSYGGMSAAGYTGYVYNQTYTDNQAPLLDLTYQLTSSESGNLVTVTTFLQDSTNAVDGGGYDVVTTNNSSTYGNNNAFFTLVFDTANITDTSTTTAQIVYGDFSPLGLMAPLLTGTVGMTGDAAGGSMGGMPLSMSITAAAAVPAPASVWLFASAMLGLLGIRRRHGALPAA